MDLNNVNSTDSPAARGTDGNQPLRKFGKRRVIFAVSASVAVVAAALIIGLVLIGSGGNDQSGASGDITSAPESQTLISVDSGVSDSEDGEYSGDSTEPEDESSEISEEPERPYVLLVNFDHPLPEGYEHGELVSLYADKNRHCQLATADIMLEKETFEAAKEMFAAAERDGIDGFIVTSGYRDSKKQAELYAEKPEGVAAMPGYSEHETGLAFDVTCRHNSGGFEDTEQYAWLVGHCWEYGFILRYTKEMSEETGITFEPWHYRYVGKEAAKIIHELGCSLEAYCEGR